jgi:hypothetical protein
MDALTKQIQDRYQTLLNEEKAAAAKLQAIKTEQKQCKAYLREAGLLEIKKRKPAQL